MDDWRIIHTYNRLAHRGRTQPILCDYCENEIAVRIGNNDEPLFQCFWCNTKTAPGLAKMKTLEAVVKEHYA